MTSSSHPTLSSTRARKGKAAQPESWPSTEELFALPGGEPICITTTASRLVKHFGAMVLGIKKDDEFMQDLFVWPPAPSITQGEHKYNGMIVVTRKNVCEVPANLSCSRCNSPRYFRLGVTRAKRVGRCLLTVDGRGTKCLHCNLNNQLGICNVQLKETWEMLAQPLHMPYTPTPRSSLPPLPAVVYGYKCTTPTPRVPLPKTPPTNIFVEEVQPTTSPADPAIIGPPPLERSATYSRPSGMRPIDLALMGKEWNDIETALDPDQDEQFNNFVRKWGEGCTAILSAATAQRLATQVEEETIALRRLERKRFQIELLMLSITAPTQAPGN